MVHLKNIGTGELVLGEHVININRGNKMGREIQHGEPEMHSDVY
jgi:hypothetical protein